MSSECVTIPLDYGDEWKKLRAEAWNYVTGKNPNFSIDNMTGAQYKYFDMLVRTFTAFHNKQITKDEAEKMDKQAFEELDAACDNQFMALEAILLVKSQRVKIEDILKDATDKDWFIISICNLMQEMTGTKDLTKRVCDKLGIDTKQRSLLTNE